MPDILCKYCIEHGQGRKWYLNLRNYAKELVEEEPERRELIIEYLKGYEGEIGSESYKGTAFRFKKPQYSQ